MSLDVNALNESGLTLYLKDALTIMLENRPEDPLHFLHEYFQMVTRGKNPVDRAYRYLRLSPKDRVVFMDNLVAAFSLLESTGGSAGFTGREYMKVLKLLCSDFPPEIVHLLFQVLGRGDTDSIGFEDFVGGIKTCLLFEEFLEEAEDLFITRASAQPGELENVVTRETLVKMVKELATNTHLEDKQRPTTREEFILLCEQACEKLAGPGANVTFPQFVASLFRVVTPLAVYQPPDAET
mmetsp:Transcript_17009/g.28689  ORF Transcript_17009/g.28689 Transcript_17009/m.28689 type:complete len:239 (-) Transcript_17009:636-1352(-)|eukprot:CAMPEP_0198202840 /NCGR_PEP_ID=MMETSP1445-20131203/6064_1 /TAXON_ID=36898 /ORGANISM="Pyramimonas sp., Strain CCMP2087" /LENGTH=238 /DNA_ID=CAMNT_0043873955 /DNA_START=140 /DNA_END=859 /DNA_ORIENTATION=-